MNNYTSYPLNPGIRTWSGVEPEKDIVNYDYQVGPNVNTLEIPVCF